MHDDCSFGARDRILTELLLLGMLDSILILHLVGRPLFFVSFRLPVLGPETAVTRGRTFALVARRFADARTENSFAGGTSLPLGLGTLAAPPLPDMLVTARAKRSGTFAADGQHSRRYHRGTRLSNTEKGDRFPQLGLAVKASFTAK